MVKCIAGVVEIDLASNGLVIVIVIVDGRENRGKHATAAGVRGGATIPTSGYYNHVFTYAQN